MATMGLQNRLVQKGEYAKETSHQELKYKGAPHYGMATMGLQDRRNSHTKGAFAKEASQQEPQYKGVPHYGMPTMGLQNRLLLKRGLCKRDLATRAIIKSRPPLWDDNDGPPKSQELSYNGGFCKNDLEAHFFFSNLQGIT